MTGLLAISRVIDAVNGFIGRKVAWLILLAVIVATVNAIIRKVFNVSSNAWLELQWMLFGAVFLMPFCLLIVYHSWPFFWRSYAIGEQSLSAGGLPQWPAKGLVLIGFVMLTVQGISEIIKQIAIMRGDLEDADVALGHAAAAEAEAQRLLDQAKEQGLAS